MVTPFVLKTSFARWAILSKFVSGLVFQILYLNYNDERYLHRSKGTLTYTTPSCDQARQRDQEEQDIRIE